MSGDNSGWIHTEPEEFPSIHVRVPNPPSPTIIGMIMVRARLKVSIFVDNICRFAQLQAMNGGFERERR